MANEQTKPSGFANFLLVLVRIILIILLGTLIGVGLFFGFKYAYNQVVIPIQQNQMEIQSLNTRVNQQWDLIQEKNADLDDRLTLLESDQDSLNDQVSEMLIKIEQNAADLEALDLKFTDLIEKSGDLEKSIAKLEEQAELFSTQNKEFKTILENMDVENQIKPLKQDVAIFKILMQINRARIFLIQDNLGLAEEELLLANQLFDDLSTLSPENEEEIASWKARLELAIGHLPNNPVLANDDLEILWSMMYNGFTESTDLMENESIEEDEENQSDTSSDSSSPMTPTPTPKP